MWTEDPTEDLNSNHEIQVPIDTPAGKESPIISNVNWQKNIGGKVDFKDQLSSINSGFHRGPNRWQRWKTVLFSIAGAFIDGTAVLALSLFFVASAFLLAKYFGIYTLNSFDELKLSFVALAIQLAFFYMVFVRSYLGQSLGDWACGLRLGSPIQRRNSGFTSKILLRGLVIFATGIIVLPLLSLIFGLDLAGKISGVSLVQRIP
jgi:hypothetical protein